MQYVVEIQRQGNPHMVAALHDHNVKSWSNLLNSTHACWSHGAEFHAMFAVVDILLQIGH